jgi:hypothetical protein
MAMTAPTAVPDSGEISTERGKAQPLPVDAIAHLRTATGRDRVVELIVTGTRSVAAKVAVLAVRRETIVGWACSPELGEQAAFRKVSISTETPTIITEVIEQGGAWLARFPEDEAHTPLLRMLKVTPSDAVAVAGVAVEDKAALVILAAGLTDPARGKKFLNEISIEAGEALARTVRERRK